jgi:hypothetical protein
MALPAATPSLQGVISQVSAICVGLSSNANVALAAMKAGSVTAAYIISLNQQLLSAINALNALAAAFNSSGDSALNTYATAQYEAAGYSGTYVTDFGTVVSNAQACVNLIESSFPTSGGFIEAFTGVDSNGNLVSTTFSTSATASLQTALQTLISSIN